MVTFSLLHVTAGYGEHKYYRDGRRVNPRLYRSLWDNASSVDSMKTVRKNGAWYFYASARYEDT